VVAVARGEAERIISQAQADSAERLALAEGNAKAFARLAAEHKRSPELTETRLYLEAAERVLPGARKLIRPGGRASKGYELWLRENGAPIVFPPVARASSPGTVPKSSAAEAEETLP
jgi:modulator of FtsH protease HflK